MLVLLMWSVKFHQWQGFDSIMVDGSHLPFNENIAYTKYVSVLAHRNNIMVEAELGRLSGTEDDLTVKDYEAKLTDIHQVPLPLPTPQTHG